MGKRRIKRKRSYTGWIIGGVILAAVLVVGLLVANQQGAASVAPLGTPRPEPLDKCDQKECGQANAPVTIEEFSDFQ
jgi:hypothetical protein